MIENEMTLYRYLDQHGGKLPWKEALFWILLILDKLSESAPEQYTLLSSQEVRLNPEDQTILSCGEKCPLETFDPALCKVDIHYIPWELQNPWSRRTESAQVYPLAVCFYEALFGVLPPSATERIDGAELLVRDPQEAFPETLQSVLIKGLALNPSDRWQTLEDFKEALCAAAQGQTGNLDGSGSVVPIALDKLRTAEFSSEHQKAYHTENASTKFHFSAFVPAAVLIGAFIVGLVGYQAVIRISPQLILGSVVQTASSVSSLSELPKLEPASSETEQPSEELSANSEARVDEEQVVDPSTPDEPDSSAVEQPASSAAVASTQPVSSKLSSSSASTSKPASSEASSMAASSKPVEPESEEAASSAPPANATQTIKLADGSVFEGKISGDSKTGTLTTVSGDVYTGTFLQDKLEGKGSLKTASGVLYEGAFVNGLLEGNATVKYPNGDTFKGVFSSGMKNGTGTYTWKNGTTYQGTWKNGEALKGGTYNYTDEGVAEMLASGPLTMKD